jgi:hypothetical protein
MVLGIKDAVKAMIEEMQEAVRDKGYDLLLYPKP